MNNPGLFQAKWNLRAIGGVQFTRSGAAVFLAMARRPDALRDFDEWLFHLLNRPAG
jgi:hypothetical protein